MELTVDTSEASLAKVSFNVTADDFEKEYRGALRQAGRNVQMKGFRPGKIPAQVIEKRFGDEVIKEVMEHFVRRAYQQAVDDNELKPLSHPRIENDEMTRKDDGSFGLDFQVSLKPEVELANYKGLVVESEMEPVLPEQVDATIEQLRRERATPEPVSEAGLQEAGMAVCDVTLLHEDEVVFEREGMRLGLQTPLPGIEPEVFTSTMEGAQPEDVRECAATLPQGLEKEEASGAEGICRITVREAFDMVPPADESLFELLEVEDMDAFRAKVQEKLEEAAEAREKDRAQGALLDQLIEKTDLHLPEPMLEEQTQHRLRSLEAEMRKQGAPDDVVAQQLEEQKDTAREEAEKGMRALLIVETLGAKEELLVTDQELEAELQTIADRNETTLEAVREFYVKNGQIQQMAIEVLERKVRGFLYEHAEIKTPS